MTWAPILDGELAEAARRCVRDIGDELASQPAWPRQQDVTLFWAYAAGCFDDDESRARYEAATEALLRDFEREHELLQLYGGLVGKAWVLAHISDGSAEVLADVDDLVVDVLARDSWLDHYDLISGLAGYAVYFLERLESSNAAVAHRGLEHVVRHLAANAESTDAGLTWHTAVALLPPHQREHAPRGYYNLGVAHGVPGAIAVLARIATPQACELARAAMGWLVAQRLPPHPHGRYAGWLADHAPDPTRTAWCYGDAGLAVAMWGAAARMGSRTDDWRVLAAESARRAPELCGVRDAGLCHGAIGLAHLYNRCYQASADPVFRDAALGWFASGLAMRRPGSGIGGFSAYLGAHAHRSETWEASEKLLDGTVGIGLALLAGLATEAPGWDRLLLCDLPPRTMAR